MWIKLFLLVAAIYIHYVNANTGSHFPKVEVSIKHRYNHRWYGHRNFVGAVYTMSNNFSKNSIYAYGRRSNGKLTFLGEYFTGGAGTFLDNGEGVNPLISAFSLQISGNQRYLFAANAASNTLSVFLITRNWKPLLTDIVNIPATNTITSAEYNGLVYVAAADTDGIEQEKFISRKGALFGFRLVRGKLIPIPNSFVQLLNRPSALVFSKDGRNLIVSSAYAGYDAVNTTSINELVTYRVRKSGRLSPLVDTVTSTPKSNKVRKIPTPIGFLTTIIGGKEYVIVGESRTALQTGEFLPETPSVSTWILQKDGKLVPVQQDYAIERPIVQNLLGAPWIQLSKDQKYFWISITGENGIAAFSFKDGFAKILGRKVGIANFVTDIWLSSDGKYLYGVGLGETIAWKIKPNGWGLEQIQNITDVPDTQVQGIIAI